MKIEWRALLRLQLVLTLGLIGHCQFTVQPESVVQAEGLDAVFECLHPGALIHNWGIQGEFFSEVKFPSDIRREISSGGSPARIIIPAVLHYNNTVVQCNAVVNFMGILSNNATLQVQGQLQPVANLNFVLHESSDTTITISWNPPFSLNLTTAEPDIQYCVDVYNVTEENDFDCSIADRRTTLLSQCLFETVYSFHPQNPRLQQLFCFEVTASLNLLNSVPESLSRYVSGYVLRKPMTIPSELLSYQTNADLSFITWTFPSEVSFVSPRRLLTRYTIDLMSVDNPEYLLICSCSARLEVTNYNLSTLVLQWCPRCDIQRHRIYNYTITVTNEAGSSTSTPARLSTHDVQNLVIDLISPTTTIEVTCSFLAGSTPSGIFVIVYSIINSSEVHYAVGKRTGGRTRVIIDGLSRGLHNVVVYDRTEDQLPELWPAESQTVFIRGSLALMNSTPSLLPTPEVVFIEKDGGVCVRCILTPNINACILIVHTTFDMGRELYVYVINRSNVSECSFIGNFKEFNIAVFGLLSDGLESIPAYVNFVGANNNSDIGTNPPTLGSPATITVIAIAGGGLFLTILSLLCILILWILCRHSTGIKKTKHSKQGDLGTVFPGIEKPNEAYNLVKTLTTNEAYNVVNISGIHSQQLPIVTPKPVCGAHTPSPPHVYEELTEPATVEPPEEEAASRL